MTITNERSPLSFRQDWLDAVVAHCQRFVGTVMVPDDRQSIPELASAFADALPNPRVPAEDAMLRSMLIDVAAMWGACLHRHAHAHSPRPRCPFEPRHMLDPFFDDRTRSAKEQFLSWARSFSLDFSRTHPVSAARRAASIIAQSDGRSDANALAHLIGVSPRQLRREFRQTYGVTLAKYVRHAMLTRALEMMVEQPGKIEPVALVVGYKSKKNFYHVFKQTIGMTPTAFLRLPSAAARHVIATARSVA